MQGVKGGVKLEMTVVGGDGSNTKFKLYFESVVF